MLLRHYLILMSIGTGLCWLAWFFILWGIDPEGANLLIFTFFYASLFLAVVGTFSVIGFLVRRAIVKNDEIVFRHVKKTFRQGLLLAGALILVLILAHNRLLTWWNAILLLILFLALEGVIFTHRKYNNRDYVRPNIQ